MATKQKPALPPRQSGLSNTNDTNSSMHIAGNQPAYEYGNLNARDTTGIVSWPARDPRTSSQNSLLPTESNVQNHRRRLLLIYVHGFMGNETSFRSFPAHVHQLLTILLAESHVVHTKIYPRYRSKKSISFARDDFSTWLEPHEDPKTDVVLLGHSMGGLLCSEVALKPSTSPTKYPLQHRILGTINFDVPFLGMHPGVIRSGLASIFKPAEETHQDEVISADGVLARQSTGGSESSTRTDGLTARRSDALWQPNLKDPNYDTPFPNDVKLPVRKGWESAWHFISKHSKDLKGATKNLVSSHMEFGGAMANYGELKSRYGRIRILEEQSAEVRKSVIDGANAPARVRFINYYTASTGRPKKPKQPAGTENKVEMPPSSSSTSLSIPEIVSRESLPTKEDGEAAPVEDRGTAAVIEENDSSDLDAAAESLTIEDQTDMMTILEPTPVEDMHVEEPPPAIPTSITASSPAPSVLTPVSSSATLPPLPELPPAPPPLDVSFIKDADTRKMVEKEHARASKTYEKAVKEREKALAEWRKLEQKKEKAARLAAEKADKDAAKAELAAAKAKAKADAAAVKTTGEQSKPLTHQEQEELRVLKEKQRMQAESDRMKGKQKTEAEEEQDTFLASTSSTAEIGSSDSSIYTRTDTSDLTRSQQDDGPSQAEPKEAKPLKDRMFCSLPPRDANGQLDPCWVRIFMKDVDEVGAHCGLFFIDERYERLVGEVADRIEAWVHEDMDTRAVLDAMSEESLD